MLEQYEDIMSVFDVAEALCVGKNRIYELLADKKIKGFRIGRVWKIPKRSIEEYILTQAGMQPVKDHSF